MREELKKAEAILAPLVKVAEDYKTMNGRRAGTILSKVRNAHLRCQEAILNIDRVETESSALGISDHSVLLRKEAQPVKTK